MLWIGQTLNSSDPRVAEAMATGERRWLESVARRQAQAGMHAIDVHAGTFGADETSILRAILPWIEGASDLRISIDSSHPEILLELASERHHPPILNSLELDAEWSEHFGRLASKGCDVVLQLRRGRRLPESAKDRLKWTEEAVRRAEEAQIPPERVFVDPVLLPWGSDVQKGSGLLDYLEAASVRWPTLRILVGLSNVSYGHAARGELHRLWLKELVGRGLAAAIVDPFDSALLQSLP